jgi:uncharacterized protein HemY
MMKKMLWLMALMFIAATGFACPACEKNQPELLKGVSHGSGPQSQWDYVILWITAAIVLATLFFSIKWLIRPGEHSKSHIKRTILN